MAQGKRQSLLQRLKRVLRPNAHPRPEIQRANKIVAAIDAGGMPLNAAKINEAARDLGLEVSRTAPVEETVMRIRSALERAKRA